MRTQFSEIVQFKAPDGFLSAVATAARRDYCSTSKFIRRCVIGRLREAGVLIESSGPIETCRSKSEPSPESRP
jgi:hypothetical protein